MPSDPHHLTTRALRRRVSNEFIVPAPVCRVHHRSYIALVTRPHSGESLTSTRLLSRGRGSRAGRMWMASKDPKLWKNARLDEGRTAALPLPTQRVRAERGGQRLSDQEQIMGQEGRIHIRVQYINASIDLAADGKFGDVLPLPVM